MVNRVVELAESVSALAGENEKFKPFGEPFVVCLFLCERADLDGIIGYENGTREFFLDKGVEHFIQSVAPRRIRRHIQSHAVRLFDEFFKVAFFKIEPGIFFYRFHHGQSLPRTFEAYLLSLISYIKTSAYLLGSGGEKLLGDIHHIVIVGISLIKFYRRKLRVMTGVHSLVAELSAYFVNLFKAADNTPFQMKLRRYTHIHIYIEGIVMGDKRSGVRSACQGIEHGRFHLDKSLFIQNFPYGGNYLAALYEHLFDFGIDYKVDVTSAETLVGVL